MILGPDERPIAAARPPAPRTLPILPLASLAATAIALALAVRSAWRSAGAVGVLVLAIWMVLSLDGKALA